MVSGELAENGNLFVIVGGGIGGLATALALHRKGFQDVAVFERSDCLRAEGTAIGIQANGWRALDQLGVASQLRDKAILLQGGEDIFVDRGKSQKTKFLSGEFRCVKRRDLVNALANALPPETIRFGRTAVGVKMDPQTMFPVLQFDDDKVLRAEVLIGCDGSNSKVADFIGLRPPSMLINLGAVRGLTNYPNGHSFPPMFARMWKDKGDGFMLGRIPITDKLVYWFVAVQLSTLDGKFPYDPELIKQATLQILKGFPVDAVKLVEKSDLDTLSFTRVRYRNPWQIMIGQFHKGSVVVLGDAMHVMGPFLGQGGSAALEDAVVLARNLGHKINITSLDHRYSEGEGRIILSQKKIGEAFDQYVKERRMRVARLSAQTYLNGVIMRSRSSLVKFIAIIIVVVLFGDQTGHTKYDCGKL